MEPVDILLMITDPVITIALPQAALADKPDYTKAQYTGDAEPADAQPATPSEDGTTPEDSPHPAPEAPKPAPEAPQPAPEAPQPGAAPEEQPVNDTKSEAAPLPEREAAHMEDSAHALALAVPVQNKQSRADTERAVARQRSADDKLARRVSDSSQKRTDRAAGARGLSAEPLDRVIQVVATAGLSGCFIFLLRQGFLLWHILCRVR